MKSSNIKYISKRLVERKSKKAFKIAAKRAMIDYGYVIIVKDGWVVKEFLSGKIEKIEKLSPQNLNQELILD